MKLYLILLVLVILNSCTYSEYKIIRTKKKSLQSLSESSNYVYKPKGEYTIYTTGKIKLNKHNIEFVIYNEYKGSNLSESNLKSSILSVIDFENQYVPTLDIFHNSSYLKPEQVLEIGSNYYIIKFNKGKSTITINESKGNQAIIPDITYEKVIPGNIIIHNINNDEYSSFSELIQKYKQDTILVNFWMGTCAHCFEHIPNLQSIYSLGKYGLLNINSNMDSDAEAKKMMKQYPFPGFNIKSNINIEKYFNQNGFPYFCLMEKKTRRVIKSWLGYFELF